VNFAVAVWLAVLDAVEEEAAAGAMVGVEDRGARSPESFPLGPASDLLGRAVEGGDPPFGIDGEDPVRDVFEDQLTVSWIEIIDNASTVA